ncbi:MFS transporter [Streptomyces sp. NBC_01716]|uniref:MFS transporter n=1 Tax=Streptomyces sp. NBC_01716 TaxID=2975917 RepID=UPI002E3174F3|nr:MFS transporter [Streptomyces sp. NBC_01716]
MRGRALSALLVSTALVSAAVVTLGAPLVPQVQQTFGVGTEASQWSYTITLLVGATLTPLLGRLADGRRRRPAMIVVCALVTLGCAISAVGTGFGVFLTGRALQGVAVALVAMTIACARDLFTGPAMTRLVALLSITTALGAGAAYPLTTYVAEHFGPRAAYGGATSLALLVTLAVAGGLPAVVPVDGKPRLDVPGAIVLIAATVCALLAISQGNSWGWSSAGVLVLGGVALVLLLLWVRLELRAAHPLVELRLFARRDVLAAHLTGLLMGVSLYSTPVLITRVGLAPRSSQFGVGLSLSAIGVVMVPIAICNYLSSRTATAMARMWGRRIALAAGGVAGALGPLMLIGVDGRLSLLLASVVLTSCGAGATFGTLPGLIVDSVEPGETGSATSVNILLRAVGGAVGSAVTAALIGATAGPAGEATTTGLTWAALACSATCAASVVVSCCVPSRAS